MALTTGQIAAAVGGRLTGPSDRVIESMQRIDVAGPSQITFVTDEKYARYWADCRAGAVLVTRGIDIKDRDGRVAIIEVDDADLAVGTLLEMLAPPALKPDRGVHPSAVVDPTAKIGNGVCIGAHTFVGKSVRIADDALLHANVTVLDDAAIGAGTVLWPGVVIRERCRVGARCIFHPNVVIGADGFGFRPSPDGRAIVKIPQIGDVVIGDDVELGVGTSVDRAKFGTTEIGSMTKVDNVCHIGHNVRIGRCVVMVGGCRVAGSAVVEDGVTLGGGVSVRDHVRVGAGAKIAACSPVMSDVPAGATWAGLPARDAKLFFRELASMKYLPDMAKQFRKKR